MATAEAVTNDHLRIDIVVSSSWPESDPLAAGVAFLKVSFSLPIGRSQ